MKLSLILLSIALILGIGLFTFRPKNIEGPRVLAQKVEGKGFPYQALNEALELAFSQQDGKLGIRYDLLKAQPQALDRYLGLISEIGPRSAPHRFTQREQRLAYMLNAYTAGLLALVRDHCPLKSIKDPYLFSGFFWRVSLWVGGEELSLNDMAAEITSLSLGDPRVMLAISRAMKSTVPPLSYAWTPDNLEQGLSEIEKKALQEPFAVREGDQLKLAPPFKWYEHRFTPNLKQYIQARQAKLIQDVKQIQFLPLNEQLDGVCE